MPVWKNYNLTFLYKGIESSIYKAVYIQPTQRRRKDVVKTSQFWSQRGLRLVWNGSHDDLFLRRGQDVFQETSSRPLPGDVLKTSLRRLKTSRIFLVRAKGHLETIYGLSIYVRTFYLSYLHITTLSLDKLIELIWIN